MFDDFRRDRSERLKEWRNQMRAGGMVLNPRCYLQAGMFG